MGRYVSAIRVCQRTCQRHSISFNGNIKIAYDWACQQQIAYHTTYQPDSRLLLGRHFRSTRQQPPENRAQMGKKIITSKALFVG
jgi:hypothetical protein